MIRSSVFLSVVAGSLGFLTQCSSLRVEPADLHQCYRGLGPCALNHGKLSTVATASLKEMGRGPRELRARPLETLQSFDRHIARDGVTANEAQALVEQCVFAAQALEERAPDQALGLYLVAARRSSPYLSAYSPEEAPVLYHLSQFATARIVEALEKRDQVNVPGLSGNLRLVVDQRRTRSQVDPSAFASLLAADRVKVNELSKRVRKLGVGAPFVAEARPPADSQSAPYYPPGGRYQPVTAVLHVRGREATLRFYDAMQTSAVSLGNVTRPLAADYSAAWGKQVDADPNKKAILALLRPAEVSDGLGLSFIGPFRPDAIPVVFVHGLASNGGTWDETINGLLEDPVVRQRFQFWIYQYPTGYQFLYPAAEFREVLREVQSRYNPGDRLPAMNNMVLVGHSMGGLISSVQVRRTTEGTWKRFFKKPIDELDVDDEMRERLGRFVNFEAERYIRRVIFVATPHRGSTIADGWVGRLFSRLIKLPQDLVSLDFTSIVQELTDTGMSVIDLAPTSVSRLQYYNPVLKTLVELPFDENVRVHTIAGDRGLGNAPDSSDGVVSYQSSHLQEALSEKLVPARHSAHRHPEAIEEIRRILLDHLKD